MAKHITKSKFAAIIKDAGRGGAYVEVPFDIKKLFGTARLPVKVTFDKQPYRGTIVRYNGKYMLPVIKTVRNAIGKAVGDQIEVCFSRDTEERKIAIPDDLQSVLVKRKKAAAAFARLSYTHQKEYVNWIVEAKRPETRLRRIERTIEALISSQKL